ncbi:sporulation YhaL family protein [Bacillus alkalicellulosilyticus]|uniref:sporulation YhaL family protein n=1 Tax=Alkalihalobacterium alkalicellulosilyticum TaxID=1912214 RepID=UPI001FEC4E3F|nr:sporulation YhaL family protein [Bacillus alkalicellulosilyticus]
MEKVLQKKGLVLGVLALLVLIYMARGVTMPVLLGAGPLWVYIAVLGIIYSGFMMVKYTLEDKDIDKEFIEKEGEIYMERIETERQRKKAN